MQKSMQHGILIIAAIAGIASAASAFAGTATATMTNTVTIGNDCIIRQGCTLGNRSLDARFDAPILGSNVNVGAGAKILGAVKIGDFANIGANAVVLSDVPAGATAVGIPARIVKTPDPRASVISNGKAPTWDE